MSLPRDAEGNVIIPDATRERIDQCVARIAAAHLLVKGPDRLLLLRNDKGRYVDMADLPGAVFGDDSLAVEGPYRNVITTQLRNGAKLEATPVDMYPLAVPGSYTEGTRSLRTLKLLPDGAVLGIPDGYVVSVEQLQARGVLQLVSQTGSQGRFVGVHGVLTDGDPAYANFDPDEPLRLVVPCPDDKSTRVMAVMQTAGGSPRVEAFEAFKSPSAFRPEYRRIGPGETLYYARYRKNGKVQVLRLPEI